MFQIGITNTINQTTPVYSWSLTRLFLDREAQKRQNNNNNQKIKMDAGGSRHDLTWQRSSRSAGRPDCFPKLAPYSRPCEEKPHVGGGRLVGGEIIYGQVRRVQGHSSCVILERWIC